MTSQRTSRVSQRAAPASNVGGASQVQAPQGAPPASVGSGSPALPAARPPARRAATSALAAAGRAAINSSAAAALGAAARGVGNTVLPPAARAVGWHVLSSLQRASPAAADLRRNLQSSLDALKSLPPGADPTAAQEQAHQALLAYAQSKASYADALLPVLHKAAAVGVAGAGMAFGVGRSSGVALADTALRMHRGDDAAGGFHAAAVPPGRPGTDAVVNAVTQAALGSALGGVGNFLGQTLVLPLVNCINKQTAAVDLAAVVPDAMVARMNEVHPGAGDALRRQASSEQARNVNVTSDRIVAVGQFFFDAANAARATMQGSNSLGLAGNLVAGTAVSTGAGAATGATIAINSALAKVSVPDMAALSQLAAGSGADALKNLPHHDVPLFYTKRVTGPLEFKNPVKDPVATIQAAVVLPSGNAQPAPVAKSSVLASGVNALTSMAMRGAAMLKATAGTTVVGAMAPAFVASMPNEATATAARAAAAAVGIHTAIKPWFDELAVGIPARDRALVQGRQEAVNDDARRRQAQMPAQPAQASLQMVPLNVSPGTP
jgi:hypothetical protein